MRVALIKTLAYWVNGSLRQKLSFPVRGAIPERQTTKTHAQTSLKGKTDIAKHACCDPMTDGPRQHLLKTLDDWSTSSYITLHERSCTQMQGLF